MHNDQKNQTGMPAPLMFTVKQAAAALNVSEKTIRRFLSRGILTSSNAVRKKLIPRTQIEDFQNVTCVKVVTF